MKQIDIFGNEVEPIDLFLPRKTIKEKFRKQNGYLKGLYCKNCKYHKCFEYNRKYYHKCEKIGISHSKATDIRLKDTACILFEELLGE